jgi:hypothetical protein
MPEGMKWDAIPPEILIDCAQLTKANSIEGPDLLPTPQDSCSYRFQGNKKDNVTVIYTPWRNLLKQAGMATGQVGFHRPKDVRKVQVEKRTNEIINRLNKTRVEKFPDLAKEKADWEKEEKRKEKAALEEKVPTIPFPCPSSVGFKFMWGAKRVQKKEEEQIAKEKKDKFQREQSSYEELYGREATQRALVDQSEGYDPEEDFW